MPHGWNRRVCHRLRWWQGSGFRQGHWCAGPCLFGSTQPREGWTTGYGWREWNQATSYPGAHAKGTWGVYEGIEPSVIETWPADTKVDPDAYREAAADFKPGDIAIIFTPDDTHYDIAMECINRGMHVMITKPPVKTLKEHRELVAAAQKKGVLVVAELHKRFDPIYVDARDRIRNLGPFHIIGPTCRSRNTNLIPSRRGQA